MSKKPLTTEQIRNLRVSKGTTLDESIKETIKFLSKIAENLLNQSKADAPTDPSTSSAPDTRKVGE